MEKRCGDEAGAEGEVRAGEHFLVGGQVVCKEYEESEEGIIRSWAKRTV